MSRLIGYAKIARSIPFNPGKFGMQGDAEAPQLLVRLARRNPDVTWLLIGRHGSIPEGMLPPNVVDPWTADGKDTQVIVDAAAEMDGAVIHLGQHGTSHIPIPFSKKPWGSPLTSPLMFARNYGEFVVQALNNMGDRTNGQAPVSWVCTDPRNYAKARDVKWPTNMDRILAQHDYSHVGLHERFRDIAPPSAYGFKGKVIRVPGVSLWEVEHVYKHGGLELMILPDDWETWGQKDFSERVPIGVASSSYYDEEDRRRRSWYVRNWMMDQFPDGEYYGPWDDKCVTADLGHHVLRTNKNAEFPDLLGNWRCTFALPPSSRTQEGVQWTTAKPFQCFAARVACFLVGTLDAQGWILPATKKISNKQVQVADGLWSVRQDWTDTDIHLARWLRVNDPALFARRVQAVSSDEGAWNFIQWAQRDLLRRRWDEHFTERIIEHQLGLS